MKSVSVNSFKKAAMDRASYGAGYIAGKIELLLDPIGHYKAVKKVMDAEDIERSLKKSTDFREKKTEKNTDTPFQQGRKIGKNPFL